MKFTLEKIGGPGHRPVYKFKAISDNGETFKKKRKFVRESDAEWYFKAFQKHFSKL